MYVTFLGLSVLKISYCVHFYLSVSQPITNSYLEEAIQHVLTCFNMILTSPCFVGKSKLKNTEK